MKKGIMSNIMLIIILVTGLSIVLYPSVADWWNSTRQTQIITNYSESVANMDNEEYNAVIESAEDYNAALLNRFNSYLLDGNLKTRYFEELNFSGNGIMGYVEVPKINVMLPIYHGVEEKVLQVAIGHIDWTSLPVGGESTHCVISGHRGLPSARLFTDLDQLGEGDVFMLSVLNRTITYQVDQIKIVEPHVTEDLIIEEGKDYCTLVTCTPYGVNSHRMLVRGVRVDNIEQVKVKSITADAVQIEPVIVALFIATPILLVLLIGVLMPKKKPTKGGKL